MDWDGQTGAFGSHAEGGEDMSRMHRHRIKNKRGIIQLLSAVLLNGYMVGFRNGKIFTGKTKAVCVPVLNCYSCPGALGACPIGSMQDLLHKIPVFKWDVPKKWDRPARYLKYIILLALVILLPAAAVARTGVSVPYFCKYLCPAGTLGGALPLMGADPALRELTGALFDWKLIVLAVVLIASMFISRPFCRYLCPLGAFYALFNRFSFYQMQLDKIKCTGCKTCERACPMAVEVTKNINSAECIRCGKCKSACPVGAISSGFAPSASKKEV